MQHKEIYQYTKLIDACYSAMKIEENEKMKNLLYDTISECINSIKKDVESIYNNINRD